MIVAGEGFLGQSMPSVSADTCDCKSDVPRSYWRCTNHRWQASLRWSSLTISCIPKKYNDFDAGSSVVVVKKHLWRGAPVKKRWQAKTLVSASPVQNSFNATLSSKVTDQDIYEEISNSQTQRGFRKIIKWRFILPHTNRFDFFPCYNYMPTLNLCTMRAKVETTSPVCDTARWMYF